MSGRMMYRYFVMKRLVFSGECGALCKLIYLIKALYVFGSLLYQLLVVWVKGTERQKAAFYPRGRCAWAG